ncbi:MAG: dephospho-CoA kinase [Burkholderiaceae bacterium]|nr:dephospho-CoA kinase [Burkholderiaceae bacterium]
MIADPGSSPGSASSAGSAVAGRRLLVGLTGGIGSGKSTVADLFAARGAAVVDTDAIAHELTAPGGAAIAAIRAEFGDAAIRADGALDRDAMRERAFADPGARRRLEAILHPMIRAESRRRLDVAEGPYALLVVPLLVESGDRAGGVDRILVVDCPVEVQVERVMRRSGLSRARVETILAAQASRAQRLAAADDVIDNGGPPDALDAQVEALHRRYLRGG